MMRTVKIVTNTPGPAPKAVEFAEIKNQGKIPYANHGTETSAPMSDSNKKMVARGMGAAKRGGSYIGI
jgi:hypothetical protein|tara:strand:- start:121 stop:324 length:204 start_codon:yes stop_codon:yes gene_type:complete